MNNQNFIFYLLLGFLLFAGCNTDVSNYDNLDKYIDIGDFFSLLSAIEKENMQKEPYLYYSAIANSKFSKNDLANKQIDELLKKSKTTFSNSKLLSLHKIKLQNHVLLNEYEQAYKTGEYLLSNFSEELDSVEIFDIRNEQNIWKALKETPKLNTIIKNDFTLKFETDKLGLKNLTVSNDHFKENFIFDTGANFSTISKSTAIDMGLKIIDVTFEVGSISGNKVNSSLAIADTIIIGDAYLENVVFLVFEDKDLTIEQIDFKIRGIIGFPEIKSLGEIKLSKNSISVINDYDPCEDPNVYFEFLMPHIQVLHQDKKGIFQFDTGANTSHLFYNYYKLYSKDIDSTYKRELIKIQGAGGLQEVEGYKGLNIDVMIGSAKANLTNINLDLVNHREMKTSILGNLGQDYVQQFDEMTINFNCASVKFK